MKTTVGLLLVMVGLITYLLLQQNREAAIPVAAPEPAVVVVREEPKYPYPTSSFTPWGIPAYSYGSMYDYRRFHAPRQERRYASSPMIVGGPSIHAYSSRRGADPYPVMSQFPSMVPRAGMSHPGGRGDHQDRRRRG